MTSCNDRGPGDDGIPLDVVVVEAWVVVCVALVGNVITVVDDVAVTVDDDGDVVAA